MMRTPRATAPGFALLLAAGTIVVAQAPGAAAATAAETLVVNANIISRLVLGITDASPASGATALQWTNNGTADHLWRLNQG